LDERSASGRRWRTGMSLWDLPRPLGFERRRTARKAFATTQPTRQTTDRQRLPRLTGRDRWLLGPSATRLFWLVALVVTLVAGVIVASVTYTYQKNLIRAQAQTTSDQFSSSLMGFLDKFRLMPPILARSAEVLDFYNGRLDSESARRLLNATRGMSGARQIRFLDLDGEPIAASDGYGGVEELPNEAGKVYFRMAMTGRLGRGHSTVGTERLYHFAAPVHQDSRVIGVIVLDASLALVEQAWALSRDPVFTTDQNGIVFMGNRQLWLLEPFNVDGVQQGGLHVEPSSWEADILTLTAPEAGARTYLHQSNAINVLEWQLHVLADMSATRSMAINVGVMTGLGVIVLVAILWSLLSSRRTAIRAHRRDYATALRLERKVRDRTRVILATNDALQREIVERRHTEAELYRTQEELLHSAKLAAIGQTSAALSHEFNQPLSAIRFNAENAKMLLALGQNERVDTKLDGIVSLVDRMGNMSRMLRVFASRRGGSKQTVVLSAVLEDVALLMASQLEQFQTVLDVRVPRTVTVLADPVGLSHVFTNLIANACEAMRTSASKTITITASVRGDIVHVRVKDTGPGIAREHIDSVFEPFFTTRKIGQGLGLGLAIVKAIVESYDGRIEVANDRSTGGAAFSIRLGRAQPGHSPAPHPDTALEATL